MLGGFSSLQYGGFTGPSLDCVDGLVKTGSISSVAVCGFGCSANSSVGDGGNVGDTLGDLDVVANGAIVVVAEDDMDCGIFGLHCSGARPKVDPGVSGGRSDGCAALNLG